MSESLHPFATTPILAHRQVLATRMREAFGNVDRAVSDNRAPALHTIDRADVHIGSGDGPQ
ncbi:hypothetical protein NLM24_24050 [Nocardia zapadnayensis]|uniref:hypothetical protein n=1 Tax=Nocardia rhamnosiphila TaxID=426716 RepID=UPI0022477372|nr:hypothetical protein [Nocardia zapadnayensis]MCX0273710.1 hypothetical protein [Nocardia zapadnayensis]